MRVNIVAGGPIELIPDLSKYDGDRVIWVGVDRGVFYLLKAGIKPAMAFGDFDSVSEEEMSLIEKEVSELKKFKPEKDETDMELALNWALTESREAISVFGATGGRIDHLMANVQLLLKSFDQNKELFIEIIDTKNILFMRKPGRYTLQEMKEFKYVSFLPVTSAVSGITLENFKYPLKDCHIPMGSTLCISNELIGTHGTFSFSEGILLVVRSRD